MIHLLRHLVRGCGTLPHCGPHPGTEPLLMMLLFAAAAGAGRAGGFGALAGFLFMFLFMGIPYLIGAYDRSRLDDRIRGSS